MSEPVTKMDLYFDLASREAMKIELYLSFAKIKAVNFIESSVLEGKYNKVDHILVTQYGDLEDPFAIIKFVARETAHFDNVQNKHMYGQNNYEKSLVDQWIQYFTKQLNPALQPLYAVILSQKTVTKAKYHNLNYQVKHALELVDEKLKLENFICGNFLSLADICLAADLHLAFRLIFTQKYRKTLPYLTKWYETISKREEFQAVYGLDYVCQKQIIPETFLPEDGTVQQTNSNNALPALKVLSPGTIMSVDDLKNLKQSQNQLRRNSLGYHYFKRLLKGSDKEKKEKMGMLWQTFQLLNCTFWKVKYTKDTSQLSQQEIEEVATNLIQKCNDNVMANDDYGLVVAKKEQDVLTIIGVFCTVGNNIADWMKPLQNNEQFEITELDPVKDENDKTFVQDIWSSFNNVIPNGEEKEKGPLFIYKLSK